MTYSPTKFQFTHLLQGVYDKLEQVKSISATSGTTATVVDTTLTTDYQDFSDFDGTVAIIATDAAGLGAAPEGEYALVTNYTASTKTLTFATSSFTAAVAAGDIVLLAQGSLFPFQDVKRKCNTALRNLGDIPLLDTTLTTAANQTEYNMPTAVPWNRIIKIDIQGTTADADDNRYFETPINAIVVPPTVGGTALIVLDQLSSGYEIRITYLTQHPKLVDYDDDIEKAIHPALAVAACALECASINRQAAIQQGLLDKLQAEFALELRRHPMTKLIPTVRGLPHWSSGSNVDPGIPDPIS